jgi:hypothetical protein
LVFPLFFNSLMINNSLRWPVISKYVCSFFIVYSL